MSVDERPDSPRLDRRSDLVAAAYHRIAQDGFEGLRTRDVARDAGVNIATLHYYFPTKEALIRGVIGYALQRFSETLPKSGSPLEVLRSHLGAIKTLIREDTELWAVLGELVLRVPRDAELREIFARSDHTWHHMLSSMLSRCQLDGSLDATLDPDATAVVVMSAIRGLSLSTQRNVDLDRVFDQLEKLLRFKESP